MSNGVPPDAIEIEGKSRSTRENAQFSIALLRGERGKAEMLKAENLKVEGQRVEDGGPGLATPHPTLSPGGAEREIGGLRPAGAKRVIIVTTWYH